MIDFKKINFGCSDANTEAQRFPQNFKEVFFDPHNYIEELVCGDKFMLIGRKGDGKTAFGAQVKLTGEQYDTYVQQRSLENFNNNTFLKIKTTDLLGGNQYISFWKCILLMECVSMIYEYEPNIQAAGFINVVDMLKSHGFMAADGDISFTVTKLVEMDSTLNMKGIFQHSRKHDRETELRGAAQIYSAIRDSIQSVYLHSKFLLIIDGLDDILYNSEFKSEIITGLIRAAGEINSAFKNTTLALKIIILIRDDILNLCRDPNLSKFIRDSGIRLSWSIGDNPFESDLIQMVEKRVDAVTGEKGSFENMWKEIFPETIGARNSMDYMLDNIIFRPRDILQLFIELQKEFVPNRPLSVEKIQTALGRYSDEYFVDTMRDQLTGFFSNDVVTLLPNVLSKMGTRLFYLSEFERECANYPEFQGVSARNILEKLFVAGYIGQHRPRERMDFTVFSYRNRRETFHPDHQCIVHRGLTRALTID